MYFSISYLNKLFKRNKCHIFQSGQPKRAAGAAFTYYMIHPEDSAIIESIQYYRTLDEVQDTDFKDLERKQYQVLFKG